MRQDVDGLAQALMGFAGLGNRGFRLGAAAQEFVAFGNGLRRAREARLARLSASPGRARLSFALLFFETPNSTLCVPVAPSGSKFWGKCLKKK
ncbi:hypothetical protein [Bradyrhizobium sp. 613_E4_N2_2]|uniref:hypothetical protein n=1 Tax=Bradyrhizobium sp. 613_E4_N2_2 TaxID=3240371 RepID=UPI003F8A784B